MVTCVRGITESTSESVLREMLHSADSSLISETIDERMNESRRWKEAVDSNGLKCNLCNTTLQ